LGRYLGEERELCWLLSSMRMQAGGTDALWEWTRRKVKVNFSQHTAGGVQCMRWRIIRWVIMEDASSRTKRCGSVGEGPRGDPKSV